MKQWGRFGQEAGVASQSWLDVFFESLSPGIAPSSHLACLQFSPLIRLSAFFRNLV